MSIIDMLIMTFVVICILFVCSTVKKIFSNHTRQLPSIDVFEYTVVYKRAEECAAEKRVAARYSMDCIDNETQTTNLTVSKKVYNEFEKGDHVMVIYKNGKFNDIGKVQK